jgi:hypothetical protein
VCSVPATNCVMFAQAQAVARRVLERDGFQAVTNAGGSTLVRQGKNFVMQASGQALNRRSFARLFFIT